MQVPITDSGARPQPNPAVPSWRSGRLWELVVPRAGRHGVSMDAAWRQRLLGGGLALLSLLLISMAAKDLIFFGPASLAFHLSLVQCAVFIACFLAFRFLAVERGVFLAVFIVSTAVLWYSIYSSGIPHPVMMVWVPVIPFLLAVYRGARFVLVTTLATLLFLILYGYYLHLVSPQTPSAGAFGEVTIALIAATGLALLFRHVQLASRAQVEAQARLIRIQTEALRADLAHASAFQRSLMPRINEAPFLDIATVFQPKGPVSGDVYAIYWSREGALNVFLGDASGHGVASAFLTMMVHIGLHQLRADLPPATILERLNANLNAHNLSDMFVTGVYVRIEPTGRATVAHAGHPSLLMLRSNTREVAAFQENGVPMGLFGSSIAVYHNETVQLGPGDILLLHTDGLTERANSQDELYGLTRLAAALPACAGTDLDGMLRALIRDADAFARGRDGNDDLSLIALRLKG